MYMLVIGKLVHLKETKTPIMSDSISYEKIHWKLNSATVWYQMLTLIIGIRRSSSKKKERQLTLQIMMAWSQKNNNDSQLE